MSPQPNQKNMFVVTLYLGIYISISRGGNQLEHISLHGHENSQYLGIRSRPYQSQAGPMRKLK